MYSASEVSTMITNWKLLDISKAELVVKIAEACLGWPYVWGSLGELDTVDRRKYYMNRSSIAAGDIELIRKRCQVLSGSSSSCSGCKYYPKGYQTRMFDCRGFTRKVLEWAGCGIIQGAGATSQWNTNSNWSEKGLIKDMPRDAVCCVFKYSSASGKMEHTGLHVGNGRIIHCSVEVKTGNISDKGWTHYAIPKGIEGGVTPLPDTKPTLRKGAKGEYVTLLQTKLIQRGYDLAPYGADGSFGNKTLEAVKKFQANNDLTVDGIVGPKTWNALESGETKLYTVTIKHIALDIANEITTKYGGTMTLE